jgi:HD superfamily phosphohydrolase YqeK
MGETMGLKGVFKMDPNDLIDTIVDAIDYAEIARDNLGLNRARRLLNNDLRQAIDVYIQNQVSKALSGQEPAQPVFLENELN